MSSTATPAPNLRFLHKAGYANVRPELEAILGNATRSLRAAVCFFTEPGRIILSPHESRLKQPKSYFVASVDFPTNINSLQKLHQKAPGHVYIHLGGKTPEEKHVGRSLMHSKIFLAEGEAECSIWVGSHNLTAMAIEGGNLEAGLTFDALPSTQVVRDATAHLEACRTTAELFDPKSIDRYRGIQTRRRGTQQWDIKRQVLVIHAENSSPSAQPPFIVHIHVSPTELDSLLLIDRSVRLFLHQPDSLRQGLAVNYNDAELWEGEITAVVRTESHPTNRGATGQFASADFDIDITDLTSIPMLRPSGRPHIPAKTQAVMRFDKRGDLGAELYSIGSKSPVQNVLDSKPELEMHEVDEDMSPFFTQNSLANGTLLYRPVTGIRQELNIDGYQETMHSSLNAIKNADGAMEDMVNFSAKAPKRPIDPFFFLSRFVIRSNK